MRLKNKMVANALKKKEQEKKEQDFFNVVINKGVCKISGLDKELNPYRIFEYQGKEFIITLREITK